MVESGRRDYFLVLHGLYCKREEVLIPHPILSQELIATKLAHNHKSSFYVGMVSTTFDTMHHVEKSFIDTSHTIGIFVHISLHLSTAIIPAIQQ